MTTVSRADRPIPSSLRLSTSQVFPCRCVATRMICQAWCCSVAITSGGRVFRPGSCRVQGTSASRSTSSTERPPTRTSSRCSRSTMRRAPWAASRPVTRRTGRGRSLELGTSSRSRRTRRRRTSRCPSPAGPALPSSSARVRTNSSTRGSSVIPPRGCCSRSWPPTPFPSFRRCRSIPSSAGRWNSYSRISWMVAVARTMQTSSSPRPTS